NSPTARGKSEVTKWLIVPTREISRRARSARSTLAGVAGNPTTTTRPPGETSGIARPTASDAPVQSNTTGTSQLPARPCNSPACKVPNPSRAALPRRQAERSASTTSASCSMRQTSPHASPTPPAVGLDAADLRPRPPDRPGAEDQQLLARPQRGPAHRTHRDGHRLGERQ